MKKNLVFVLALCALTVSALSVGDVLAFSLPPTTDTPQDEDSSEYFKPTDPCGYVMGTADTYPNLPAGLQGTAGTVQLSSMGNNIQGCFDASGYAYRQGTRYSRATYVYTVQSVSGTTNTNYTIDFVGTTYQVSIDQTTGYWSGYGYISDTSFPGTSGERWVWFDWTCSSSACTSDSASKYYVQTQADGTISGYAWNDYFGFINFTGLTQELPPQQVYMDVDVLASDDTTDPEDITNGNIPLAPIADGYDYWRIRIRLTDAATNAPLTTSDVSSLTITPSATGKIYLNQVEDTGDAIAVASTGVWVKNPNDGTYSVCTTSDSCVLTEKDSGSGAATSWNTFVTSASPTSLTTGLEQDTDPSIDYLGDREGCRWIYWDQWHEVDGKTAQTKCGTITPWYYKADYFYDRVNDRNEYILNQLNISVNFTNPNTAIITNSYLTQVSSTSYLYTVHDSAGNTGLALNWRPRYLLKSFYAYYDSADHDEISPITSKAMSLKTNAVLYDASDAFYAALGTRRPGLEIYYQLDVDSDATDPTGHDLFLLMDTATDGTADCTRRKDTIPLGYATATYVTNYVMAYGTKANSCGGTTGTPTNTVSNPTAEQWVCDKLRGSVAGQNPSTSCYYPGYLPRIDVHKNPAEPMLVIGAINSTIDQDGFISNDSTLSVLGSTDVIKLRNKMYAQIVRYSLGQTASTSQAHLDENMEDSSGVMLPLLDDRLFYTEGDIIVDGSSGFQDGTWVTVGGNIIFLGNLTGGRGGFIALQDEDGNGGNMYLHPAVTTLYANLFMDGGLYSYDGTLVPTATTVFNWPTEEVRLATLLNQFYLNGSIMSGASTINGAPDDTTGPWPIGDGTTTTDFDVAREHDLNQLRQYRLCYELNSDGTLSTTEIECSDGQLLSDYGRANGLYNSFILDYSPADELPIFRAESGLFQ
jgi:hypothetical protein